MSSAASRPPQSASTSTSPAASPSTGAQAAKKPAGRSLLQPPARPKPPVAPPPKPPAAAVSAPPPEPETPQRPGPISLPSERMQYRAIGLLKGKYVASEEQFNRGDIAIADGTLVDAVLLGRVTSLIKKHIDLEKEHLWVVYPRTLYKDKNEEEGSDSDEKIPALHVQIVGVWEPETLNPETVDAEDENRPLSTEEAEDQCDKFSVRGEVAKYSEEDNEILINIVQKSKSETAKPKRPFKLLINGQLSGRTVGYFWDLKVERKEGKLILTEAKPVAVVPPKKKPKGQKGGGRKRPMGKSRGPVGAPKPKPKPKTADSEPKSEPKSEPSPAVEAPAETPVTAKAAETAVSE
ncbi:MAG: hypothetical protein AAFS04_09425 [Cyanobacteria bacterium J06631_9]